MTRGTSVYLAGLMGAGKSSVARCLGRWLDVPYHDIDQEVERSADESVAGLWEREGEAAFRTAEREAVERLTAIPGPAILALGGGTLEDDVSRDRLAAWGTGVHLDASPEQLAARVGNGDGRPLLPEGEAIDRLTELGDQRQARYRALPHRVDAGADSIEAVAVRVLRAMGSGPPEAIGDGVRLGRGALGHAAECLANAVMDGEPGRIVVVTDDRVWSLHGGALGEGLEKGGWTAVPCLLASGEAGKEPLGLQTVWDALAETGADRDTPVAVLGGGAASDVGGLAASTFKRGLPLVLFPTTLLGQVDAAIGGKNAINFSGYKNLLGTFYFPSRVDLDPLCLLTLGEREYRAGWAEVVKAGLIGDPDLFDLCGADPDALLNRRLDGLETAVRLAVDVKLRIVAEDPREGDVRRWLNLGHSLGHAIEAAADGSLAHGEAVAIGMVAATRLSDERGIAEPGLVDRVVSVLEGLGLPTTIPSEIKPETLVELGRHDKKRKAGALHAVLPVRPGEVVVQRMDDSAFREWVEASCA